MPKIGPQSAMRPRPLLGSAGFRRPCPPQKDPSDRIADLHAFALRAIRVRVRSVDPQEERLEHGALAGGDLHEPVPELGHGAEVGVGTSPRTDEDKAADELRMPERQLLGDEATPRK